MSEPTAELTAALAKVAELEGALSQITPLTNGDIRLVIRLTEERDAARRELDEAHRERDLAIAHDRQPYPTAEAYELVCAAREKYKNQLAEASALNGELREVLDGILRNSSDGTISDAANLWQITQWAKQAIAKSKPTP